MKRILGMLSVIVFSSSIAGAELIKNFKYDGKVEVTAYQMTNGSDFNSNAKDNWDDIQTRVQLNAGFDLNDDVNAVVSVVKNNRSYGTGAETLGNRPGAPGTPPNWTDLNSDGIIDAGEWTNGTADTADSDGIVANVQVEQAYLNIKGVLGIDHKLGRQYYGNEGDLIVYYGPTSYPYAWYSVTALDSWTGWYKTGKWDMHALYGKLSDNYVYPTDVDVNLDGITADYNISTATKFGAYLYEKRTLNVVGAANDTLDVAGFKAAGKFMGFDYYGEFAKNYGNTAGVKYTGYALLANAKYAYDLMGQWVLMGEYAIGSGDSDVTNNKNKAFYSINSDYRPGVIMGQVQSGLTTYDSLGVARNTGLTTWNVGAKWTPSKAEKLDLTAKYFVFAPTETKQRTTAGGLKNKVGYTAIASELDFAASWKHSENVSVRGTLATFMPDKKYANTALTALGLPVKHDAVNYAGLDFIVKF